MARNPGRSSVVAAPETIFFKDPSKAALQNLQKIKSAKRPRKNGDEADKKKLVAKPLKRADYHDMLRYNISESKGKDKSDARRKLAIALGAKPPKQAQKNFKLFLEQQKLDKEEHQKILDEQHTIQAAIQKAKPKTNRNKRKFKPTKRGEPNKLDGQIGRYKRGIQFISSRDLKPHGLKSRGVKR
ncbi:uncharacterized protein LOC129599489 [Paramacrobiotus metropolitanus]|uniref:uncharacterized protein LOC129599489 n=1 Tax=Paramacrobiotus metropolitanus TaxID=2943436 RepID=UPI0024464C51|nr:uncharacterized protein LOC129599489 [Paramacrobiotus metropolitanus]